MPTSAWSSSILAATLCYDENTILRDYLSSFFLFKTWSVMTLWHLKLGWLLVVHKDIHCCVMILKRYWIFLWILCIHQIAVSISNLKNPTVAPCSICLMISCCSYICFVLCFSDILMSELAVVCSLFLGKRKRNKSIRLILSRCYYL